MRLAGEDDLDGVGAGEQLARALEVLDEQLQALVGREAPREADRQRIGVEGLGGRSGVRERLSPAEALAYAALAHGGDQADALLAPRRPQLVVGDLRDGLPRVAVGAAGEPVLAQVAVQQRAHRRADPCRLVHAVGDVADRHLGGAAVRPQSAPHPAGDLAVAAAHTVLLRRAVHRELGEAERARVSGAARVRGERAHRCRRPPRCEPPGSARERLERVGVVARRHRRVRGEEDPPRRLVECPVERRSRCEALAGELQRREGGMALVEVQEPRLDSERAQRAHAANAEQQILRETQIGIADVEPGRDPASRAAVLRAVAIEQIQGNAPHVDAPDLGDDVLVPIGTVTVMGSPSASVTSAAGSRSGSVSDQDSCWRPLASMRWRK